MTTEPDDWSDEDIEGLINELFELAAKYEKRLGSATVSRAMIYQSTCMLARQLGVGPTVQTIMTILEDQNICKVTALPLTLLRQRGAPS